MTPSSVFFTMLLLTVVGFVLVKISNHFAAPGRPENVLTPTFGSYRVIGEFFVVTGLIGTAASAVVFVLRQLW